VNPLLGQHADRLLDAGVAGTCTSHGAENNLYKIGLLLEHDESNTFGMEDLLRDVGFEEAYFAVALQIGNPPDREENEGRGYIDPARTASGLVEAGGRIEAVAGSGGAPDLRHRASWSFDPLLPRTLQVGARVGRRRSNRRDVRAL
jgi:hypothetical protein